MRLPRLANDDKLYRLESDLAQLIVAIAVDGHRAYEIGMKKLVCSWAEAMFTKDPFWTSYIPQPTVVSFKVVQERNGYAMRISKTMKDLANRGRKETSFAQGWVKSLIEAELALEEKARERQKAMEVMEQSSHNSDVPEVDQPTDPGLDENTPERPQGNASVIDGSEEQGPSDETSVIQIQEKDRRRKRVSGGITRDSYGPGRRRKKRKTTKSGVSVTRASEGEDGVPSKYKQLPPQNNSAHVSDVDDLWKSLLTGNAVGLLENKGFSIRSRNRKSNSERHCNENLSVRGERVSDQQMVLVGELIAFIPVH